MRSPSPNDTRHFGFYSFQTVKLDVIGEIGIFPIDKPILDHPSSFVFHNYNKRRVGRERKQVSCPDSGYVIIGKAMLLFLIAKIILLFSWFDVARRDPELIERDICA
jgi:hypothetical protein